MLQDLVPSLAIEDMDFIDTEWPAAPLHQMSVNLRQLAYECHVLAEEPYKCLPEEVASQRLDQLKTAPRSALNMVAFKIEQQKLACLENTSSHIEFADLLIEEFKEQLRWQQRLGLPGLPIITQVTYLLLTEERLFVGNPQKKIAGWTNAEIAYLLDRALSAAILSPQPEVKSQRYQFQRIQRRLRQETLFCFN